MVALLPVKKVEGWNSKRNTQWITGIIPSEIKTWVRASDIEVHQSYNTHIMISKWLLKKSQFQF